MNDIITKKDLHVKLICNSTEELEKLQEKINILYEQGYIPKDISSGERDKKHELCILMLKHP